MHKRLKLLLMLIAVALCFLFLFSLGPIVDRYDVMATSMACSAKGEDFAKLQTALSRDGVKFEALGNGLFRVGYRGKVSTRWRCELSLDSEGRIARSQRLP
jgi:hypothetical protein